MQNIWLVNADVFPLDVSLLQATFNLISLPYKRMETPTRVAETQEMITCLFDSFMNHFMDQESYL